MKVDKEALLKQKFWILLGAFALLWLLCLSVMWANAGGPLAEAQANYDKADKAVKPFASGARRPKNDSFLGPWTAYAERFQKHKDTVWKAAWYGDKAPEGSLAPGQKSWEGQQGIYTWPSTDQHPLKDLLQYPDSPFDVQHREWYKSKEAYQAQFDNLNQELTSDATAHDPNGPPAGPLGSVVFAGGFEAVTKPVDWETATRAPDAEECWLAQEDFWVKREVLYAVREALEMAARLNPVEGDAADKTADAAKYVARRVFSNDSWQLDLLFEKSGDTFKISPDSIITNVHVSHRDQALGTARTPKGVWFRIRQGTTGRSFAFEGEKLAYKQFRPLKAGLYKEGWAVPIDPTKPFDVEQVFDVTNTPVAAVNEIRIPYYSNRNANRPLIPTKPDRYGKKEAAADASKTPGALPVPGVPPAPVVPPMSGGSGGMTGGGNAAVVGNPTANKFFDRNRYLFVTDQSRHLPLAFTLTVDQSHLSEILVAVANSRLRFQTTQVEFKHKAPGVATSLPGGVGTPSFGGSGPTPGGSGMVPGPGTPTTPPAMGPSTAPAVTVVDTDNPNLVELTIYGVASLYERPRAQ